MTRSSFLEFFSPLLFLALAFNVPHASALTLDPGLIQNDRAVAFSGTVATVSPCYMPSGYAFTVGTSTAAYIFRAGTASPYPANAVPQVGAKFFAVLGQIGVCDKDSSSGISLVSGRMVTYFSTALVGTVPPPAGTTTPPSVLPPRTSGSTMQDIFGRLQNLLKDLFKPPGASGGTQGMGGTGPTASGGAGGMISPFNFGGPVSAPIPCDPAESTPTGTTHLIPIGPPRGGAFLYNPALARSYECGPPLIAGQNTLGSYTPTGICDVCLGPEDYCPSPGVGFLNALPGHGTSGCVLGTTPKGGQQDSGKQVSCRSVTRDTKGAIEIDMRTGLTPKGISVNHPDNAAGCGYQVDGVKAHCTDVSGLQCGSLTELQNLASSCGGFTITGGSELGHSSQHTTGNAVDISGSAALDKCIKDTFQSVSCPPGIPGKPGTCWFNPASNSVYWAEPSSTDRSGNPQPPHWHVCMNGYCPI